MSDFLHVQINGDGMIVNESRYELLKALARNRPPEFVFPNLDLVSQILSIAKRNLEDTHGFQASLPNGEIIVFTGEHGNSLVSNETIAKRVYQAGCYK